MGKTLSTLVHDAVTYFTPEWSIALFLLAVGATVLLMGWPFSSNGTKE